jgi:hypothetical protein
MPPSCGNQRPASASKMHVYAVSAPKKSLQLGKIVD